MSVVDQIEAVAENADEQIAAANATAAAAIEAAEEAHEEAEELAEQLALAAMQTALGQRIDTLSGEHLTWRADLENLSQKVSSMETALTMLQPPAPLLVPIPAPDTLTPLPAPPETEVTQVDPLTGVEHPAQNENTPPEPAKRKVTFL